MTICIHLCITLKTFLVIFSLPRNCGWPIILCFLLVRTMPFICSFFLMVSSSALQIWWHSFSWIKDFGCVIWPGGLFVVQIVWMLQSPFQKEVLAALSALEPNKAVRKSGYNQERWDRKRNVCVPNQSLSMCAPPFTISWSHSSEAFLFLFLYWYNKVYKWLDF